MNAQTTTNTPGQPVAGSPITDASVLRAGDLLWGVVCREPVFYIEHNDRFIWTRVLSGDVWVADYSAVNFIGRPDPQGWIPWAGGENPVGDAVVEVRFRDRDTVIDPGNHFMWQKLGPRSTIIAFRLSPRQEAGDGGPSCAELDAISAAIGTVRFMDPPDGGSVSLAEQVRRMRAALDAAEALAPTDRAGAGEAWYGDRHPHEVDQVYGEYDGTSCEQCGRERVMLGAATGRRICEKCGTYQAPTTPPAGQDALLAEVRAAFADLKTHLARNDVDTACEQAFDRIAALLAKLPGDAS